MLGSSLGTRTVLLSVGLFAVLLASGCGISRDSDVSEPAPPPPDDPVLIKDAHWCQVCQDGDDGVVFEVEDVVNLSALPDRVLELLPPAVEGETEPFVDVAVSYRRKGGIRAAYLLDHNVSDSVASDVSSRVVGAIRPQGRLLDRTNLRVRVTRSSTVNLQVLPPRVCRPHVWHEDRDPPEFPGVRAVGGTSYPARVPDTDVVEVRLHLDSQGELVEIDGREGDLDLLPRVRASVDEMIFDPALVNGEGVPGTLDLRFHF